MESPDINVRLYILFILIPTVFMLALTECQHQLMQFLHRRGLLHRAQSGPVPQDREVIAALIGILSVSLPLGLLRGYFDPYLKSITTTEFNITEVIAVQALFYVSVDTWYFWGHRLMHRSPFLWHHIHKHHHVKKNITVWTTAYAAFFENFFLSKHFSLIFILKTWGCFVFSNNKNLSFKSKYLNVEFLLRYMIFCYF